MTDDAGLESMYSKVKVHNEIEFCEVTDKALKDQIEKILLANRISYYIKWGKQHFFSTHKDQSYTFCINAGQQELAEQVISDLQGNDGSRIKFLMKKLDKPLF